MKNRRIILSLIIFTTLITAPVFSQNTELSSLSNQYKKTRFKQDSLQLVAKQYRERLQNNPSDWEKLTEEIISIEDQLYEIADELSNLATTIRGISPQALAKIIGEYQSESVSKSPGGLSHLDVVSKHFSKQDIKMYEGSAKVEQSIIEKIEHISELYSQLKEVKQQYETSLNPKEVDSLSDLSIDITEKLYASDNYIFQNWQPIYDRKIELSLIVADDIGLDRSKLERLQEVVKNVRRSETLAEEMMAPNAYLFAPQLSLVHSYELALTEQLGLTSTVDSIKKRIRQTEGLINQIESPVIDFQHRSLVLYSEVNNRGEYDFEGVNVPQLVIPDNGVYYAIRLYSLKNPVSSLDSFHKLAPLRVTETSAGMYQYVVGGFKKYADAQSAVNQIKKFGYYRATVVMAWIDGASATLANARAKEQQVAKENAGTFKVEIRTQNSSVISNLRSIVDSIAEDIQITRSQDGQYILFTVMEFDGKQDAETLRERLEKRENTEIKIIKLD